MKKLLDGKLVRFLLVGVLNTAVGFGVMFALYNLVGLHTWGELGYWLSSAANYVVGSIISYALNKHFTFQCTETGWRIIARFILNITVCWVVAYGLAKPAVGIVLSGTHMSAQLQGNWAMLAGAGLFVLLNYIGQRFYTFRAACKEA